MSWCLVKAVIYIPIRLLRIKMKLQIVWNDLDLSIMQNGKPLISWDWIIPHMQAHLFTFGVYKRNPVLTLLMLWAALCWIQCLMLNYFPSIPTYDTHIQLMRGRRIAAIQTAFLFNSYWKIKKILENVINEFGNTNFHTKVSTSAEKKTIETSNCRYFCFASFLLIYGANYNVDWFEFAHLLAIATRLHFN